MNHKRLKRRNIRRTRNKKVKKGAGIFDNFRSYGSRAYNATRKTTGVLAKSGMDVLKSKYLFTLLANPSSVHRMLFKNGNFIEFIDFPQIERLYCGPQQQPQQQSCIVMRNGYLYSNNPEVVNSANNQTENMQRDNRELIESGANTTAQQTNTPPAIAAQVNQALINAEIASEKLEDEMNNQQVIPAQQTNNTFMNSLTNITSGITSGLTNSVKSTGQFMSDAINRLSFAKLNDALLTDDMSKVVSNPEYISFKQGYEPLFEVFSTFKYQVQRTLWSGGWSEWMFIIKEMIILINNNPQLMSIFSTMIWETTGSIKIIQLFLKKSSKAVADKLSNAIANPNIIEEEKQEINAQESAKATQKNRQDENEQNVEDRQQSRFSRFARTMKRGIQSIGSALGTNVSKYRAIRVLIKYYDIDPDKYNFNILKRTGILKKNYPLFMDREARKAVQIAINNCRMKGNVRITNITPLNPSDKSYLNKTLDQLLNELMAFNTDANTSSRYGGRRSRKNGRTNRRVRGGGSLFFDNIKFIFSETYKLMIQEQMNQLGMFMNNDPTRIQTVALLFSRMIRGLLMASFSLCMTLGNMMLGKFATFGAISISTPHCYIANSMFFYIFFMLLSLDMDKVNILKHVMYGESGAAQNMNMMNPVQPVPTQNMNMNMM